MPVGNMFYIFVPLVFLCLYKKNKHCVGSIKATTLLLVFTIVISIITNINEVYISTKVLQRDVTIIILLLTFNNLRGDSILKPYIWVALIYIAISQISYAFGMPLASAFFDTVYHISDYYTNTVSQDISNIDSTALGKTFRLGGIFYNSNNCASYICLIYGLGLSEHKQFTKKEIIIFAILCLLSLFYTGSRTSLIVFCVITITYFYLQKLNIIGPTIIILIVVLLLNFIDISEIRMFKIDEGMDNSFGVKINILNDYLRDCSSISDLIFGSGSTEVLISNYKMAYGGSDFEIGDIIIMFGFLFFMFYVIFTMCICKCLKREYMVIIPFLLWSLSNTVICSYRMSAVWLITIGILLRKSIDSSTNGNYANK